MGNACQPFGYSIDEGMKAFCVGEMCVGIFHLIMASVAFQTFDPWTKGTQDFLPGLIMVLYIVLMVCLIVQFVMGLLLYFLGFKQRNVTICLVWIVVACINFTIPWLVMACGAIYCGSGKNRKCYVTRDIWSSCWLYLLYIILGVYIVVVYMKWAKSAGIAVQYSTTQAGQSQSQRSAKVANQDNEA